MNAARAVLVAEGSEGLTMRALARKLGVAPNALYSYIGSRSEVIDLVLDDVLGDVDPPDPAAADWRDELQAVMDSTYDVLLATERLVPLYAARYASGPNAVGLGERMLELLARGGLDGPRADEALRALIVFTVGFASFATRDVAGEGTPGSGTAGSRASFESGLGWLLAGIAGEG